MKSILWPATLAGVLACAGCGHVAKRRDQVQSKLEEHSRALTTAVVDTLQQQPAKDDYSKLALELAREDQKIEGFPTRPIEIEAWLGNSNLPPQFEAIHRLLERRRALEERLITYGSLWEEERNARRARFTGWFASVSVVLTAVIALCVLFPVAIPILGRVLAWIVGKIPALASALGVVSVKAFDAIVKGVEKSRATNVQSFSNSPEGFAPDLKAHLAREMDSDHKALVRARKAALNL